jgi:hypothetical protein
MTDIEVPNKPYMPGDVVIIEGVAHTITAVAHTNAEIEVVTREPPFERRRIKVEGPRSYKVVVNLPLFGRREVFIEADTPSEAIEQVEEMPILELLGIAKVSDIAQSIWTERQE